MGLGKPRTSLGKWMDLRKLKQEDLAISAKVNRDTISKACSDSEYIPSAIVMRKIIKALREVDPSVRASDFWDV